MTPNDVERQAVSFCWFVYFFLQKTSTKQAIFNKPYMNSLAFPVFTTTKALPVFWTSYHACRSTLTVRFCMVSPFAYVLRTQLAAAGIRHANALTGIQNSTCSWCSRQAGQQFCKTEWGGGMVTLMPGIHPS